jgi:hypothetical protein
MGITVGEIAAAIQSQNQAFGVGQIGAARCPLASSSNSW